MVFYYGALQFYQTTRSRNGVILKCDLDERPILSLPFEFFEIGSHSPKTVSYLLFVARSVASLSGDYTVTYDGQEVKSCDAIKVGMYKLLFKDASGCIEWKKGPQSKYRRKPFRDEKESSVSESSRATGRSGQSEFRERLRVRYQTCPVTGQRFQLCVAAHIVPQTLGQVFLDELVGAPMELSVMSEDNGLLLNAGLHQSFDMYYWSLYYDGEDYIFHDFFGDYGEYHGRKIQIRTSRSKVLFEWHYMQTLMARARAFAYWPPLDAIP